MAATESFREAADPSCDTDCGTLCMATDTMLLSWSRSWACAAFIVVLGCYCFDCLCIVRVPVTVTETYCALQSSKEEERRQKEAHDHAEAAFQSWKAEKDKAIRAERVRSVPARVHARVHSHACCMCSLSHIKG